MRFTGRLSEAFAFAMVLHGEQRRKGTETPYITHLMSVAALVGEYGGDEDLAIAAMLHDAVEDQGGAPVLVKLCRLGNIARVTSRQLHRQRVLFGATGRHFHGLLGGPDHRLAGNHFRYHKPCPATLDQPTKRHVADPGHGSQNDRIIKGYIADANTHEGAELINYRGKVAYLLGKRVPNATLFPIVA